MDKRKTVVISEEVWRRVKHQATDDSITLREAFERGAYLYLGQSSTPPRQVVDYVASPMDDARRTSVVAAGPRELTYAHGDD